MYIRKKQYALPVISLRPLPKLKIGMTFKCKYRVNFKKD